MGRAIGGTLRAWQEYEAGRRRPRQEALAGLARLGVNVNWVLTGEGPIWSTREPGSRGVVPPLLLEESNTVSESSVADQGPIAFQSEWLRSHLGVHPERTALLMVHGNALEPTIRSGDLVVVDRSVQVVREEGIYALEVGHAVVVRRAQLRTDGAIHFTADQGQGEPLVVPLAGEGTSTEGGEPSDTPPVRTVGRVAGILRRL